MCSVSENSCHQCGFKQKTSCDTPTPVKCSHSLTKPAPPWDFLSLKQLADCLWYTRPFKPWIPAPLCCFILGKNAQPPPFHPQTHSPQVSSIMSQGKGFQNSAFPRVTSFKSIVFPHDVINKNHLQLECFLSKTVSNSSVSQLWKYCNRRLKCFKKFQIVVYFRFQTFRWGMFK
jgi:hypothetical protein